jgi:hypothetical protein
MTEKRLINLENLRQEELRGQERPRVCVFCGGDHEPLFEYGRGVALYNEYGETLRDEAGEPLRKILTYAHQPCYVEAGSPLHPELIREARLALRMNDYHKFAAALGAASGRTARRWEGGQLPIPEEAEERLREIVREKLGKEL